MENKELIKQLLDKGILISKDILDKKNEVDFSKIPDSFLFLNSDLLFLINNQNISNFNSLEFERLKAESEKTGSESTYYDHLNSLQVKKTAKILSKRVSVVTSYGEISKQREVNDFTHYFNSRLNKLQKILYNRDELKNVTSINRILAKTNKENVSLIGLVKEKNITKNNNMILTMEDSTGEIKVLVNKNRADLFNQAKDIVLDEVLGISGVNGQNIVFANNLFWPDIPISNQLKKTDEEGYAIFLSDLHVGSNNFLEEDFSKFLDWLNQKTGSSSQKEIASKIKYIFIVGDLVDGVGIYPGQEEELVISDVVAQYEKCTELLSKIPSHIEIIVCGGNHDALRIAEPQPIIDNEFCQSLKTLPNITLVSNPSVVNIHSSNSFEGYNVLLYHGYSFDYYIANVDSIRNNGGYERADLIMKFLLKKRHLAPTHSSTLYIPYTNIDPLIIDIIPDIFVTGHIHKSSVSHYKNITLICGSCWQKKTAFQEKVGHTPEPSRVPIINLKTREAKVLKFGK